MNRHASTPRREPRVKKLVRLGAYCAFVTALAGGLALRSAYGSAKSSALEIGSELGRLGAVGSESPILMNGQPIYVSSTVQPVDYEDVLDRVEARCEQEPMALVDALPGLPDKVREELRARQQDRAAAGVVRHDNGGKGMVACFMRPEGSTTMGSRVEALNAFVDTGDLSKLGSLRYVFAERTENGSTHVVTAWTDGPFNLYSLVPSGGDTPGSDLPGVPRPLRSVRLLTASVEGVPYSVRIYDSEAPVEAIVAQYDTDLTARGWELKAGKLKTGERVYGRGGAHVYVLPREDKGRTLVSLIQMPGAE
ncbi:hypothetical protein [Chondromyces apiculatus]|uniref:Uncharacterized protein n=1 Tax=Chondromyces apiculatus DSM 436 TaxID=1192034 RepID=A0A017TDD1_9BACT|nr:hypothetical protein [Chondromyces apiculatus]EYF06581.1 Hypothetical protein CAP_1711 [Chondromyces apiculatus DSM 436]